MKSGEESMGRLRLSFTLGVSPRHCVPRGDRLRLIISLSLIYRKPLPDEEVILLALGYDLPLRV
jgi:hypothetical protein